MKPTCPLAPLLLAAALLATACIQSSDAPAEVLADGTVLPSRTSTAAATEGAATAIPFTPVPVVSDLDPQDLHGFTFPIDGGCLPSRDEVMPNAPRDYRAGVNEGVDFYFGDVCTEVVRGTPVLAMFSGVVIRADHAYTDITQSDYDAHVARSLAQGFTDEDALDALRGRQVWIDHGNGVVSRYASLDSIEPTIAPGLAVHPGDVIGAVGESGTIEATTAPGTQIHLHVEVRVGDTYLAAGLPPDEVRRLYQQLFAPAPPSE